MSIEKQLRFAAALFVAMAGLLCLPSKKAQADYEQIVAVDNGTYIETRVITLSNSANTQVVSATQKRPAMLCRNNSAYTVWIGSDMASTSLIGSGFPILSSETFKTDKFTGSLFALLDASGVGNLRCLDGLNR